MLQMRRCDSHGCGSAFWEFGPVSERQIYRPKERQVLQDGGCGARPGTGTGTGAGKKAFEAAARWFTETHAEVWQCCGKGVQRGC